MTKRLNTDKTYLSNEYDYEENLNWRDDGDVLYDASMNDYLKGYNIDPYQFTQWAKKNNKNLKEAANETIVMDYGPEYLANNILMRWNGADGQLQDFFNAYTLRYPNILKQQICEFLSKKGYKVYPILLDETPRYAKLLNKIISQKNTLAAIEYGYNLNPKSESLTFFKSIISKMKDKDKLTFAEASELLNYYSQIFPKDYAIDLTQKILNCPNDENVNCENFKDFNMSDESLNHVENYMSGNADPIGNPYDGGLHGYDFISDFRNGLEGVSPNNYLETRSSKKKH